MPDVYVTHGVTQATLSTSPIDVTITNARYDVSISPIVYLSVAEDVDAPLLDFSVSDNSQYIALSFP